MGDVDPRERCCDRCGVEAFMWFWKAEGRANLRFCKHHGEEQQPILEFYGFRLTRDLRHLLNPQPAPA